MYMYIAFIYTLLRLTTCTFKICCACQKGIDRFQQTKACSRLTVKMFGDFSVLIVQMASKWVLFHLLFLLIEISSSFSNFVIYVKDVILCVLFVETQGYAFVSSCLLSNIIRAAKRILLFSC